MYLNPADFFLSLLDPYQETKHDDERSELDEQQAGEDVFGGGVAKYHLFSLSYCLSHKAHPFLFVCVCFDSRYFFLSNNRTKLEYKSLSASETGDTGSAGTDGGADGGGGGAEGTSALIATPALVTQFVAAFKASPEYATLRVAIDADVSGYNAPVTPIAPSPFASPKAGIVMPKLLFCLFVGISVSWNMICDL